MKINLLLLATSSLLLLAPAAQVVGAEHVMGVNQEMVINDTDLTKSVKDALSSDTSFSAYKIDVSVDKGVVTLSGKVDTIKAKMDLESRVLAVPGVHKVINNIVVGS